MSNWPIREIDHDEFARLVARTNATAFVTLATACGYSMAPSMIVDEEQGVAFVPKRETRA